MAIEGAVTITIAVWIGVIGTFGGFGMLLDHITGQPLRKAVADFLFGEKPQDLTAFETGIIRTLLSLFIVDGSLRILRIAVYSVLFGIFAVTVGMVVILLAFGVTSFDTEFFGDALFIGAMSGVVSIPLDFLSLKISKFLFIDNQPRFPSSIGSILVDIFLTVLMYYFLWTIFGELQKEAPKEVREVWLGALLVSTAGSTLWNFIQIASLIVGVLLRNLLLVTRSNGLFKKAFSFGDKPFTFLLLAIGIVMMIVEPQIANHL